MGAKNVMQRKTVSASTTTSPPCVCKVGNTDCRLRFAHHSGFKTLCHRADHREMEESGRGPESDHERTAEGGKARQVDLQPDSALLDPHFEGYKLALDAQVSYYVQRLPAKVLEQRAAPEQYSAQHARIFAYSNLLTARPSPESTKTTLHALYTLTAGGAIVELVYNEESRKWWEPVERAKIDTPQSGDDILPVSLVFISSTFAVVCGGASTVAVYDAETWSVIWKGTLFESNNGVVVEDSTISDSGDRIDLLLHGVRSKTDEERSNTERGRSSKTGKKSGLFVNRVTWITLQRAESGVWDQVRRRDLEVDGHVEWLTLQTSATGLTILANASPALVADTNGLPDSSSVPPSNDPEPRGGDSSASPEYLWMDAGDHISIHFLSQDKLGKNDVRFAVTRSEIDITVLGRTILHGVLAGYVDVENSTWTLDGDNRLEVTLFKSSDESLRSWETVVVGDTRGRRELNAEALAKAESLLERFTSDASSSSTAIGATAETTLNQLEECDAMDEDEMTFLYGFNDEKQSVTWTCNVSSHQMLFASPRHGGQIEPRICFRHDVDGLQWAVGSADSLRHIATFNALGYVSASKRDRRWIVAPSSSNYAALVEGQNHAFVYWQTRSPVGGDLRNRKTGQSVQQVSKQQIIALRQIDPDSETTSDWHIVGCYAIQSTLFLLTPGAIVAASFPV